MPTNSAYDDYVSGWLLLINTPYPVPPFCCEIVFRDGKSYYLHSILQKNENTKTLTIRVWDLRALNDSEIEEIKKTINELNNRHELTEEHKIHPKLDYGNMRLRLDDIMYCIEWHDRLWPEEDRPKIGF